jgi:hypothetical protein
MNAPSPSKLVSSIAKPQPDVAKGRNGKIARLPKAVREMINQMLDDNLPHKVIIEELGEAGTGLNAQNLTNWRRGGYQDHLKQQAQIERSRAQMEFAADLLKDSGPVAAGQVIRACNLVAATQVLDVIVDYGEDALKKMLQEKPLAYLTLLNTICNMSNAAVRADQHRIEAQEAQSHATAASVPQQPPLIHQSTHPLIHSSADSSPIKPNQARPEIVEAAPAQNVSQVPATAAPPLIHSSTNPPIHSGADSSPIKPNQGPTDNIEDSAQQDSPQFPQTAPDRPPKLQDSTTPIPPIHYHLP